MRDPGEPRLKTSVKAALIILGVLYAVALLGEFVAPYDYREQTRQEPSAPATMVRFTDSNGEFHLRPFIYRSRLTNAREMEYTEDASRAYPITFFVHGTAYDLLWLVRSDTHLVGVIAPDGESPPQLHLLGTDQLGRDRFSRLVMATRFSLLVSPAGTVLACLIGIVFGMLSGYSGRAVDSAMMAVADTVIALPTLILILAARAAFPLELPPMRAATLLISIFALTGWAEMARLTRGQVIAVKNLEFITAARALGAGGSRILSAHVLPNIAGALTVQATLILPSFFLAEVALSFLGVGLQEPEPSLGNMLTSASDLTQLSYHPVLLLSPAVVIFLFVLATRLLSRGHRNSVV
ncbi:MAG: ABC transporter permease [Acidobacteria bacterium]|nr:ABC transporter permease [Acidobacteriota bacterium]